ncbi:24912_t:CDS:2 [Cetraspora pellucida]|uniref:24912_t:CDS:1 n=1 Tax=Cetraspora pellucida TaxID=1433469 RepID=A0A9N9G7J8_9GLOM|nr:24912_t:CDS:2 [Cetraspora pellucida]
MLLELSQPETYDELLSKLSLAMHKMYQFHIIQKKESKSDEWFLSLQYLHCNINDLLITNFFLDSTSEFERGNSKHISESLGWYTDMPISVKDKDDKSDISTGNFACINNNELEPIKATEVNELEQQVSDIYNGENLKKNMTYLKTKDGHIEANLLVSFINFSRSAFLLNVSNKVCAHCDSLNLSIEELIDEVKRLCSELDNLTSQITRKDISLKESKIKIKNLLSKIKILKMKLSSTQNKLKEITALWSMKKILESKLELAQKDVFSTQEEIVKKKSKIISLKSELINIKNEPINTKDELALKINEIECLGTLRPALGGTEKNTQNEEQSFISNSEDTLKELEIRGYVSSKSLAKYFKSKNELVIKENETLPIITNKQKPELLIQDITIERAVYAGKALVNDKY